MSELLQRIGRENTPSFVPTAWIIFDVDGVLARWPSHDLPQEQEQAHFFSYLHTLHKEDVAFSVLTNRSPATMQVLAYQLGVNYGLWITESGGSIYSVADHKSVISPKWIDFAKQHIPSCRSFLENSLGITGRNIPVFSYDEAQFEPGMGFVKTVIVPPRGQAASDYFTNTVKSIWENYPQSSLFKVEPGKAVDIDPQGLSKSIGMIDLLESNGIDPQKTPTLFIADATRDILAATELLNKGGYVGAVGNSSTDFIEIVKNHSHGIIAPENTRYHSSIVNIFDQFFRK